jgi:hypothetical protein
VLLDNRKKMIRLAALHGLSYRETVLYIYICIAI